MTIPLYYLAGFSTEGAAQEMTIKSGAATGTIASTTYSHVTFASLVTGYSAFSAAVVTALASAVAGTYTVNLALATGSPGIAYTIYSAAGFTLSFPATAAGARCKAALGFSSNTPTGAGNVGSPYVSDVRPIYAVVAAMDARSDFSDVYEPDDITDEAISDGGTPYSVSRLTSELDCDWTQTMETKAATFTGSATAAVPWTWQAFSRHVRGQRPFGVYEAATAHRLYRLRADNTSFHPQRVEGDYDGLWNIPFRTRDLGALP